MSDTNDICGHINESIDDLITSVDAMRWTPTLADTDEAAEPAVKPERRAPSNSFEPAELKAQFDALYERIDAFAGAVDDRMQTWANRVETSFAQPTTPARQSSDDTSTR